MASPAITFRRALVVDDDADLARVLARLLQASGVEEVAIARSTLEARAELDSLGPDLLLCDLCLDAESGIEVIEYARRLATPPTVVAMSGAASREEVFGLLAHGVSAFLEKPFDHRDLLQCLSRATDAEELLARAARARVGSVGAREAQRLVRETMFREALALTNGNRHAAARLLKVDRRLVQLMAQELEAAGDGHADGS